MCDCQLCMEGHICKVQGWTNSIAFSEGTPHNCVGENDDFVGTKNDDDNNDNRGGQS